MDEHLMTVFSRSFVRFSSNTEDPFRSLGNPRNLIVLSLTLILLFILAFPASADETIMVTPSSRVTSYVKVRSEPKIDDNIVGSLSPGKSAVCLNSFPHWYHVRLDDGTEGFVSKTWTDRFRAMKVMRRSVSPPGTSKTLGRARPMIPKE